MPIGCTIHSRVYIRVYLMYIHSVGFCIAYSNYRVFLGPQTTDKQQKESAFFMSVCNQAMKTISEISYQIRTSQKLREFIRFAIVGVLATGIHYGIYLLLLWLYDIKQDETTYADIAYTIGYVLSFLCNLWLTAHFTFREKLTIKRGGGFALSHIINYLLHIALLSLFLWLGVPNKWAPIPVYCLVIPINFILVRTVFKSEIFKK